jgi:type II secretory pathway component PulM
MNQLERQLERLLKSAAAAPRPALAELSFATEARVLAAWRRRDGESELQSVISLFRRGLVVACGVAALVAVVSWQASWQPASAETAELAAANSVLRLALVP